MKSAMVVLLSAMLVGHAGVGFAEVDVQFRPLRRRRSRVQSQDQPCDRQAGSAFAIHESHAICSATSLK